MTAIPMGQHLRELNAESVYLPPDLQERVHEATLILRHSAELARFHFDAEAVNWSAGVVGRESHRLIAKWLRGEGVAPRSSKWCEFVLAAERAEAEFEELYYHHLGQDRAIEQALWREENAEELSSIAARRARPSA